MSEHFFITGFPGFIAERLIPELAQKSPDAKFTMLVEARFKSRAEDDLKKLAAKVPTLENKTTIIIGDITRKDLDISNAHLHQLANEITQVFHLAAIYDLAIDYPTARAINVDGTANIIEFCKKLKNLKKHNYISTCYVAGTRTGTVMESELNMGQGFKNHYESTKFAAEVLVRESMDKIPTSIYRPSVVVGDSTTGETAKYDGPYFPLLLLMRLPTWLPIPYLGEGRATINIVPVDFIVKSLAELSQQEGNIGKTFQLADPDPMLVRDFWALALERLGFSSPPKYTLPMPLVKLSMKPKSVRQMLRIPMEALAYFDHQVSFDTTNTVTALKGTGVACPHISTYLDNIIEYARHNPKLEQLRKQIY
ncbi:MAG: SDR family oxidoreductase [Myxococcota bacterium]